MAMFELTPANSSTFTNSIYFNADPRQRLMGAFYKFDSMSTGLVPFLYMSHKMLKPIQSPGHPEAPVVAWKKFRMFEAFGGINPTVQEGICGAPFVELRTGNFSGFFHLATGEHGLRSFQPWTT